MSARRRPASDPRRRLLEAMAVMGAPLPAGGYSAFTCYDTKTPQGKALAGARLLRELEQAGFVTRVGKSNRYVITLKGRRAANGFGLCDECTSASTAGGGAA